MSSDSKEDHFDVGQNAYETAKKAWAFGKGVAVVNLFLGAAENVAGKVLDLTQGKNLQEVDKEAVQPALAKLDDDFLNPAICKLLTLIMPLYKKAEEKAVHVGISTLISNLLKQVGLLKEASAEEQPSRVVTDEGKTTVRRGKTQVTRKASPVVVQ
jgi:hypothetical protein